MVDVDEEEEGADKKAKKTKKVKQVTKSWSHLNEQKPIWMRKPEDVSAAEYGKSATIICICVYTVICNSTVPLYTITLVY